MSSISCSWFYPRRPNRQLRRPIYWCTSLDASITFSPSTSSTRRNLLIYLVLPIKIMYGATYNVWRLNFHISPIVKQWHSKNAPLFANGSTPPYDHQLRYLKTFKYSIPSKTWSFLSDRETSILIMTSNNFSNFNKMLPSAWKDRM